MLVEIKSGQTPNAEWGETLRRISTIFPDSPQLCVVYGEAKEQVRSGVLFVPWRDIGNML